MTHESNPQELFIEWPHTKVSITVTDLKVRTTTKPLTGVKTGSLILQEELNTSEPWQSKVLRCMFLFAFLVLTAHKILRSDDLTDANVCDSQFLLNECAQNKRLCLVVDLLALIFVFSLAALKSSTLPVTNLL